MIVDRFLHWMDRAPVGQRAEAAAALARAFLYSDMPIAERDGIEAALTVLLDDPSPAVRRALAETLATAPAAPRHVILTLAADQPDVAASVLALSPVLEESDLVDLVAIGEERAQAAICRRESLSPVVAAAAAEVACPAAALALVETHGARLPHFVLRRLAERLGDRAELREALLGLETLPLDVRHILLERLSAALGAFAVACSWLEARRAARATREACERAVLALAGDRTEAEAAFLVRHLRHAGRLTPVLLLRALLTSDSHFFAASLAELAGLPLRRVATILAEGRPSALGALFDRAGLPARSLSVFVAAALERRSFSSGAALDRYHMIRRLGDSVLGRAAEAGGDADDILALVRRLGAEAARDAARAYAAEVAAA